MAEIFFFSIPAHGHTNPTIPVVKTLVKRGHRVRYFSFVEFADRIRAAGAQCVVCDSLLPPTPADIDQKAGKDFASLIEMVADTTIAMDAMVKEQIETHHPDVIVSDSVCFWGKLFAIKYGIPYVCSTTTFAFNQHSAKLMKQRPGEIVRMFTGMPRIHAKMEQLKANGYAVKDFISILQNDNDTDTIVYTSRLFQPSANTFSDRYAFVGPSLPQTDPLPQEKRRPCVYISLGTVLNNNIRFYQNCVEALRSMDCDVVISVGPKIDISALRNLPAHIRVFPRVNQLEVLAGADVFVTHCGMNSVNESLYFGVPMVLYPQHSEQYAVSVQAEALGAGVRLRNGSVRSLRRAVKQVLDSPQYRAAAQKLRTDFLRCGGPEMAADHIEAAIRRREQKA